MVVVVVVVVVVVICVAERRKRRNEEGQEPHVKLERGSHARARRRRARGGVGRRARAREREAGVEGRRRSRAVVAPGVAWLSVLTFGLSRAYLSCVLARQLAKAFCLKLLERRVAKLALSLSSLPPWIRRCFQVAPVEKYVHIKLGRELKKLISRRTTSISTSPRPFRESENRLVTNPAAGSRPSDPPDAQHHHHHLLGDMR